MPGGLLAGIVEVIVFIAIAFCFVLAIPALTLYGGLRLGAAVEKMDDSRENAGVGIAVLALVVSVPAFFASPLITKAAASFLHTNFTSPILLGIQTVPSLNHYSFVPWQAVVTVGILGVPLVACLSYAVWVAAKTIAVDIAVLLKASASK